MEELLDFLSAEDGFFIEAEAKPNRIQKFILEYNGRYGDNINTESDGIIVLQPNANKYGLELRLYVKSCPPDEIMRYGFTKSNDYNPEYSYRLNNNQIIKELFEQGCRIGVN